MSLSSSAGSRRGWSEDWLLNVTSSSLSPLSAIPPSDPTHRSTPPPVTRPITPASLRPPSAPHPRSPPRGRGCGGTSRLLESGVGGGLQGGGEVALATSCADSEVLVPPHTAHQCTHTHLSMPLCPAPSLSAGVHTSEVGGSTFCNWQAGCQVMSPPLRPAPPTRH